MLLHIQANAIRVTQILRILGAGTLRLQFGQDQRALANVAALAIAAVRTEAAAGTWLLVGVRHNDGYLRWWWLRRRRGRRGGWRCFCGEYG